MYDSVAPTCSADVPLVALRLFQEQHVVQEMPACGDPMLPTAILQTDCVHVLPNLPKIQKQIQLYSFYITELFTAQNLDARALMRLVGNTKKIIPTKGP
jgi:hypothetical protein